jgi:hypothetical protein
MKIIKRIIILCFYFLVLFSAKSQNQIQYQALRCAGQIPDDFLKLSGEKVETDKTKISKKNISRSEKRLENEFAVNSNFGIDEILFSGKVLYGDPLSIYINKIADKVLEKNPKLRKELRFYVLKSYSVNAFSTNQGIIFVTVGLISQLENEAQLAYILCHEIAHYTQKHSLESYKRKNDVIEGKGKFKVLDFDERIQEIYSYSKDNEFEADVEGVKMYLKTPYNKQAALSSFDMLLFSYLPYDEIEWSIREFQDSSYKFPVYYAPKKGKEISADEAEDDEESTHPNIRKRKTKVESILEDEEKNGALYVLGEDYFKSIQQQARIELFYILFNHAQYKKAYYLSYLYKNIYHDSSFSSIISAYSIYAKAKKAQNTSNSDEDSKNEEFKQTDEGAYYNVSFFFNKLNADELSILSIRETWKAYQNNKNDSFAKKLFGLACDDLFKNSSFSLSKFKEQKDTIAKIDTAYNVNTSGLSKVDKLKLKKKKQEQENTEEDDGSSTSNFKQYYQFAFTELFQNKEFKTQFKSSYNKFRDKDDVRKDEESSVFSVRKDWRKQKKFGTAGGIDSLIIINPSFSKTIYGRETRQNLIFNEQQELNLSNKFIEMANLNGINTQALNLLDKASLNTETMNQYALIMEWLTERINNSASDIELFNSREAANITKEKACSKICISGITYTVENQEFNAIAFVYSAIAFPVFPLYLYAQLHKKHRLYLSSVVFDIESGKIVYVTSKRLNMKYKRNDYVNSQIYSLFHQLKTKRND